jgi:hypothetical protein
MLTMAVSSWFVAGQRCIMLLSVSISVFRRRHRPSAYGRTRSYRRRSQFDPLRSGEICSATDWLTLFAVVRQAHRDDPKARRPEIRRHVRSACEARQPTGRFHLRLSTSRLVADMMSHPTIHSVTADALRKSSQDRAGTSGKRWFHMRASACPGPTSSTQSGPRE